MTFERGFKTWAKTLATDARHDLGLGPFDRLDPHVLAAALEIPIVSLSGLVASTPSVQHLLTVEPEVFSAVTVFNGPRRTIIHNDGHALTRQASNIGHELSHGLLAHPPTPALDDSGCRVWNQGIEDEAGWLSGCLLVTEQAAMAVARGNMTVEGAARQLGVSTKMITFRVNAVGARKRVSRAKARATS
jgi:Zn-dependent peptidase ImmA (M78 family)